MIDLILCSYEALDDLFLHILLVKLMMFLAFE